MNIVFLQLGSNIGDRKMFLQKAIKNINMKLGTVVNFSKIYESEAWGVKNQNNYLNQILKITTNLDSNQILREVLDIEKILGRKRKEKWGERCIDIDIILFNNDIIKTIELSVPHDYMHNRMFVLLPLSEIAPNMVHPIYKKTIKELTLECDDKGFVKEYGI